MAVPTTRNMSGLDLPPEDENVLPKVKTIILSLLLIVNL